MEVKYLVLTRFWGTDWGETALGRDLEVNIGGEVANGIDK